MSLLTDASLLLTPNANATSKLYSIIPSNGNGDFTGTRATTATRVNSSGLIETTAINMIRRDYSLGGCPNILLEPQRTNLALQSSSFDNASWSKTSVTVTANTTTSPSGVIDADTLIENTSAGAHLIFRSGFPIGTNTATIYAKANTRNFIYFAFFNGTSDFGSYFNLSNGTIGNIDAGVTAAITNAGNGWYRCAITYTSAVNVTLSIGIAQSNGVRNYTGNGTGSIDLWGAQLEAGAYATSYIPTTTASVTRNADSITRNNIFTNGLITASGGTWFVELRNNVAVAREITGGGVFINTGLTSTLNDGFSIRNGTSATVRMSVFKVQAGVLTSLFSLTTDTAKIAIKWNGSTADVFVNGVKQVSATAFTTTAMQNLIADGINRQIFVNETALFPTPLTDAQCIALTQ